MFTFKIPRFFSFVALVAAMVALVGATVVTTGAYFTDKHSGQYTGTFGQVSVAVNGHGTGTDNLQVDWQNMLPGVWSTSTISVQNTGGADESVWLVFDNSNLEWSSINTLGAYGEWDVNGVHYANLNNRYAQGTSTAGQLDCAGVQKPDIGYLPHVNAFGTLHPGQAANYSLSFRFSACYSNNAKQGSHDGTFARPLRFAIVATQQGVLPNDPHNGTATIPDLVLPVSGNNCPGTDPGSCDGTYQ